MDSVGVGPVGVEPIGMAFLTVQGRVAVGFRVGRRGERGKAGHVCRRGEEQAASHSLRTLHTSTVAPLNDNPATRALPATAPHRHPRP